MSFILDSNTHTLRDPERNIELRSIRGYSTGDKDWEIHWNGEVIGFTARDNPKYGGETKNILMGIDWYVASMKIPQHLESKRAEVMGVIKEAMEAYGLKYSRMKVDCRVQFDQRLIR
ncbi:MAG: hypothetical protein HYS17_03530 [Micavibrio aeruginosavorus]|uniref:Uncharacterized protein n=1 Tax=Micavibrio aeruginosavorus TaxID=349221 RepID=A0A7T5UHD6_9BACT|nr:MAG: hypothetical protein HYS17_03530 [Micavibrio aeruginosavorus]